MIYEPWFVLAVIGGALSGGYFGWELLKVVTRWDVQLRRRLLGRFFRD